MALAGGEVRIDGEFIAFDADFAVDDRLAARVIGEAKGNFGFCHKCPFTIQITNSKFEIQKQPGVKFGI
jgi:hypothetical protein